MITVGLYLFDEVEVLDFAGPFEVFSTAARLGAEPPFRLAAIAEHSGLISARGGLRVAAEYALDNHPALDVLLIPGGVVDAELAKPHVLSWIVEQSKTVQVLASVCTGALLLARAGLLSGRQVTTHWEDIEALRAMLPDASVVPECRWIDTGPIITSAGISAGIDMSLHLVRRLAGQDAAVRTARQMEYAWRDE